ncbi:hypothetical protein TKK_0007639 [Trichogramma kaykai]|uniref:HOOK N-terminal domain-containing protein n=1 Tax=Trichogramma kaykai TaxID=54128 RepID=A0ABD2X9S8_9HYME
MANEVEINKFVESPVVAWLITCLDDPTILLSYNDIIDGVLLHNVFLQVDPEALYDGVQHSCGDIKIRTRNLEIVLNNIRQYYHCQLKQLVMVSPNIYKLAKEPEKNVNEARMLLILLLGAAAQCPHNHQFIDRIQDIRHESVQMGIADCIKEVTNGTGIVIKPEVMDNVNLGAVFTNMQNILKERDEYLAELQEIKALTVGNDFEISILDKSVDTSVQDSSSTLNRSSSSFKNSLNLSTVKDDSAFNLTTKYQDTSREDSHIALELVELKTKIRKQRQEIEEKTEQIAECKTEITSREEMIIKLREQNQELKMAARKGKSYQDELDAAMEKVSQVDKLEVEMSKFKDIDSELDFYKRRVNELRDDNRLLTEGRAILDEKLAALQKQVSVVTKLEQEIEDYKAKMQETHHERMIEKVRYQELYEEKEQLLNIIKSKSPMQEIQAKIEVDEMSMELDPNSFDNIKPTDNRLSDELERSAQSQVLRLELENTKLRHAMDLIKDQQYGEYKTKLSELNHANLELRLCVKQLEVAKEKLENEKKTLQSSIDSGNKRCEKLESNAKSQLAKIDSLQQEIENLRQRMMEVNASNEEKLERERQYAKNMIAISERRAEETENLYKDEMANLARLTTENQTQQERILSLERSAEASHNELLKIRDQFSDKERLIDEANMTIKDLERKLSMAHSRIATFDVQLVRLAELETIRKELDAKAAVDRETLETLQADLIAEKLAVKRANERLAQLAESQPNSNESDFAAADEERARLQVTVSRLESEIHTMTSQQAETQAANRELEARCQRLETELAALEKARDELVTDQRRLQTLHDQLGSEYEDLEKERESMRASLRDVRQDVRQLRQKLDQAEAKVLQVQREKDKTVANATSLANLRLEHSKLRDDFRFLYKTAEGVKEQNRALLLENHKLRSECSAKGMRVAELQGDLSVNEQRLSRLEADKSKLVERLDMMTHTNNVLESDRRSLMDQVTLVFTQYHELLQHSLEDREQHYMEEKIYTDKVNHLHRQKEKLEEKIMDYYRKTENANKKKGLGASFVRKVRKGLFGRASSSRRASWTGDSLNRCETPPNSTCDLEERKATPVHSRSSSNEFDDLPAGIYEPGLSLPGTRRGVYYNDVSPPSLSHSTPNRSPPSIHSPEPSPPESDSERKDPQSIIVFNKVSAVINETTSSNVVAQQSTSEPPPKTSDNEASNDKDEKLPSSIWYEYGCV